MEIPKEIYDLLADVVIEAHGVLCELEEWGHGELTEKEKALKENLAVAMKHIDDIDAGYAKAATAPAE